MTSPFRRAVSSSQVSDWMGGNNGIITNPSKSIRPDAPTIGTVTINALTGVASIPFTAPTFSGNSKIISYTATSNPAGYSATIVQSGSGTINISGFAIDGTYYTFTVTANNLSSTSLPSSVSNSISMPYIYSATGVLQTYTVPANKTTLLFKIWGAGGGGTSGGTGGYTTGTYTVVPGRTYNIYVGKSPTTRGATGGYPGGGGGGNSNSYGYGFGGGGYSAIQDSTNSTYLAIAGAGGGANAFGNGPSGNGGGTTGGSVTNGYGTNGGGTQSAGGTVGIVIDTTSATGSYLNGGKAADTLTGGWAGGGGGGAGYYGGAGGSTGGGATTGGPGGSGYVNTSYTSNGTTVQGLGTDTDRGTAGNANTDGKVLIFLN